MMTDDMTEDWRDYTLTVTLPTTEIAVFVKARIAHQVWIKQQPGPRPDTLSVTATLADPQQPAKHERVAVTFPVCFLPRDEVGRFWFWLGGVLTEITVPAGAADWPELVRRMRARNAALGIEEPRDQEVTARFPVAAGFVPMHKLAERTNAGLLRFPEEHRQFHALRTPLCTAVGLALFRFTSPDDPGGWQEISFDDLVETVWALTKRDAPRRGDYVQDVLAEVVKLWSEPIATVKPTTERHGRFWQSRVTLFLDRVLASLELVYWDTKKRRPVTPSQMREMFPEAITSLVVKGRRAWRPEGLDIKALIGNRWKLKALRARWSPNIVDDLKAAPLLDKKGHILRDRQGRILRGGFNIQVAVRIVDALFRLRSERAYVAHDLLVLLATDIYKPPRQARATARNVIERQAERLFDLLGLEADPKNPHRREETVTNAIRRLKQSDIAALLPGSDELPRQPTNRDRRPSPYYRLVRSALYTPAGILSKEDAAALEAERVTPPPTIPPAPLELPGIPPAPDIPSGAAVRAAREAAGINLREFARRMGGPDFSTWSRYEGGKQIRVGAIKPEVWRRVRKLIATVAA